MLVMQSQWEIDMEAHPLHLCSVASYARVPASSPTFAKHSQLVPLRQSATTLLHQLHYEPEQPAGFSWTGDDVFTQLEERRATQLLGRSLIIAGQVYCELCPADELPSWLPLEDY
jgi:hypothetical protein